MSLTPIEHKILKVMLERKRYMTSRKIARLSRISWNTAKSYLNEFYDMGWVTYKKRGNRIYWKAIR